MNTSTTAISNDRALRSAMGRFATGVTLLGVGGTSPHAMTLNSFASVSLSPPMASICISRQSRMHDLIHQEGCFGVSVLAAHHGPLAMYFADRSRPEGLHHQHAAEWVQGPATGVPLIDDALAGFECAVAHSHAGGDHTIVVGRVLSCHEATTREAALLFTRGRLVSEPAVAAQGDR